MTLKVGRDQIMDGDKPRNFTYKDVKHEFDGWVDANKYLPADFDLLYLRIEGEPNQCGWASGNGWDGLTIKVEHKVLFWKRRLD